MEDVREARMVDRAMGVKADMIVYEEVDSLSILNSPNVLYTEYEDYCARVQ